MIRKVQYAPESQGIVPCVETTRDFVMSEKPLHIKASLEKEVRGFVLLMWRTDSIQNLTPHWSGT